MTTYALTIWQPHASLIVRGLKLTESRSWSTSYRGRLYVHAGRTLDPDAPASLVGACEPLVFGAVIGYADLHNVTGRPGDWYWHLRDPHELPEPIPCRGWSGLWRWPR